VYAHSKYKKPNVKAHELVKLYIKHKDEKPTPRILIEEKSGTWTTFALSCRHCDDAPCTKACITGAMKRLEDGRIVCDEEKCVGCWSCIMACPHGAVSEEKTRKQPQNVICVWNLVNLRVLRTVQMMPLKSKRSKRGKCCQ